MGVLRKEHEPCERAPEPEAEPACPVPSAHDKLGEAHHSILEQIKRYHDPDYFRYSLSAFFQSARSTTFMIQSELARRNGFEEWWEGQQELLSNDPDLKLLNALRVQGRGHCDSGFNRGGLLRSRQPPNLLRPCRRWILRRRARHFGTCWFVGGRVESEAIQPKKPG
jgi:hypothetical protein